MRKKKPLFVQLVAVMMLLVLGIILIFWIMNNTLLEQYYVNNKNKEMLSVYDMLDTAASDGKLEDASFVISLQKRCARENIDVVVFNSYGKTIIERATDEQDVMRLIFEAGLSAYAADSTDNIQLVRQKDSHLGTEYIIMNASLADGNFVYMKTPLESIRESISVFNDFFILGGIFAVILACLAIFVLAKDLSNPIKRLTALSTQMAALDFDAKYIENRHGSKEINELGEHMNELSETLEGTISQLKTANIELQKDIQKKEEIDEMRKEFLSNVSHELKTPLALISGYAEGLRDCVNDDEESRDFYCDVIMDETDKMNRMVMKLLSLNHLEFGDDVLEMDRFDITEVIRGVINSSALLAEKNSVKIEFDENKPLYVSGDMFKIEEVVTNYISNAINHCFKDGVIKVYYTINDNIVRVSVYNPGEPIPEESLDKVWVKFYKVDKARTREYGGSGIGLSIVKAIMDSHNRRCGVQNIQNGVEFWFELELFVVKR